MLNTGNINQVHENENLMKMALNYHDSYFTQKKNEMIEKFTRRGYDAELLKNWIDLHGIPEDNEWWIQNRF